MDVDLPTNVLERILRESARSAGDVVGVRMEAKEEYYRLIDELGRVLAELSVIAARHAGRKTVREEDVRLAVRALRVVSSLCDPRGRGSSRG
ncbi:MAG: histone family protein [Methanopyraceae archaeon]